MIYKPVNSNTIVVCGVCVKNLHFQEFYPELSHSNKKSAFKKAAK